MRERERERSRESEMEPCQEHQKCRSSARGKASSAALMAKKEEIGESHIIIEEPCIPSTPGNVPPGAISVIKIRKSSFKEGTASASVWNAML
jgi:hypothetical protein